jgi:hypothetical protein
MTTKIEAWFWGNILLGGVPGSVSDAVTGAMHEYAPNQYLVTLEAEGPKLSATTTDKSKKDKLREFIILNYPQIMNNLSRGYGIYYDSLMFQLGIAKKDELIAQKNIRALAEAYTNIPQFADQVTAQYLK